MCMHGSSIVLGLGSISFVSELPEHSTRQSVKGRHSHSLLYSHGDTFYSVDQMMNGEKQPQAFAI